MEFVAITVLILIFLSCVFGTIYLFYKAIRSFIAGNYWIGIKALLGSLVVGTIVVSAMYNPGDRAGKMALRTFCRNNIKQITLFLKMYAGDHEGKYPVTFNDAVVGYLKTNDMMIFKCPASQHHVGSIINIHDWTDYAYVSGLTEADPTNCVIMFCIPDNHKSEGANVGFLGGNVQWYPCERIKDSTGQHSLSFQELTNTPSLFYGTTNEVQLADLKKRTKIIYPAKRK
jgi:hypothetical protein